MKKEYEKPTIEIIEIASDDVITASTQAVFDPFDILDKDDIDWF